MGKRLELQSTLEKLLGMNHVYYQPPESLRIEYPAIVYSKSKIETEKANNSTYLKRTRYDVIVIDKRPDNPVINKLMELPYCSYDRQYKSDGVNHDSLTLYY